MLVLSRFRDERIVIIPEGWPEGADPITVCIVDVRGDKVRLGVEAPNSVMVHREEVYNAILRERKNLPESEK